MGVKVVGLSCGGPGAKRTFGGEESSAAMAPRVMTPRAGVLLIGAEVSASAEAMSSSVVAAAVSSAMHERRVRVFEAVNTVSNSGLSGASYSG